MLRTGELRRAPASRRKRLRGGRGGAASRGPDPFARARARGGGRKRRFTRRYSRANRLLKEAKVLLEGAAFEDVDEPGRHDFHIAEDGFRHKFRCAS